MLTIVSVVEDNQYQLCDLMIKSVNKYTPEPHEILIIDNSGKNQNLSQYPNVRVIDNTAAVKGLIGGSNRHGCGLNTGMKLVGTFGKGFRMSGTIAILDSDTVVLCEKWDKQWCYAVKASGDAHMCFIYGNENTIKETDWSPGFPAFSKVSYIPERDVGWQFRPNYTFHKLNLLDCKTDGCYFHGLQCDEIWRPNTDGTEDLIATHFGRGSNLKGKADKGFGSHQEQLAKWKAIIKELTGLE